MLKINIYEGEAVGSEISRRFLAPSNDPEASTRAPPNTKFTVNKCPRSERNHYYLPNITHCVDILYYLTFITFTEL